MRKRGFDQASFGIPSTKRVSFGLRKLPILVWIGVVVVTLVFYQGLLTQEQAQIRQLLQSKSLEIENVVTGQIETRILALTRMAQRWEIRGKTPKSEWTADAETYVKDYGGFQAIEWVDATFHVRWIFPLVGNQAAKNLYLGFDPHRRTALEAARDLQDVNLTYAIELVSGGKGFLCFVPLFKNQEFDGFILGVFRTEPLLNSILSKASLNGYAFTLFDDHEPIYSYNSGIEKYQSQWQQTRTIHLKRVTWDLQIWPTPWLIKQVQSPLPKLVFMGGLVSACLLSLLVYFAQKTWLHAQQLEWVNRKLASEVRERQEAEKALIKLTQQEREKATQLELALQKLQQTQSQLVHNEKMVSLGQMVAGVAHEINNPVNFIYGNITPATEYTRDLLHLVSLYQQHYTQPVPEISEQLEIIEPEFIAKDFPQLLASMKEGADRIRQIVIALRNFSRFDEAEHKQVNIHEGIDNTLLLLRHRLKQQPYRSEIQVIKEYGQLSLIDCYPGELNQVFMNLLGNAIDAIDESIINKNITVPEYLKTDKIPTILIRTDVLEGCSQQKGPDSIGSSIQIGHKHKSRVVISISDNGSGMTPQVQQHLFNPFFTTKPPGRGTGLGLSISYRIVVDRHGGLIKCDSVFGQGTEFAIELPIDCQDSVDSSPSLPITPSY